MPVIVLAAQWPPQAQDRKAAYAGTVLLGRYLMGRNVEIAIAYGAAPEGMWCDLPMTTTNIGWLIWCFTRHGWAVPICGADLPKSAGMLNPQFRGAPEPIDVFVVPAAWWSWERRPQSGSGRD